MVIFFTLLLPGRAEEYQCLFTTRNRVIRVFKSNQIRKLTSENPELIQKIQP